MLIAILLSCLLLILPTCEAMKGSESFSISGSDQFSILYQFEFAIGGTIHAKLTPSEIPANKSAQFLYCSDTQLNPLKSETMKQVCEATVFNSAECDWQTIIWNNDTNHASNATSITFERTAKTKDWYYILQLNCLETSYQLQLDYVTVNPDGEYLSLSEVPYKFTFLGCLVVWSLYAVVWSLHIWQYRYFNVSLHKLILLVPLVEIVFNAFFNVLWRQRSRTGVDNEALDYVALLAVGLMCSFLLGMLIVISLGYGILTASLERQDWKRLSAVLGVLAVTYWMYEYFGGFLLFLVVIVYSLGLRIVFGSLLLHAQEMNEQIHLLNDLGINSRGSPAAIKFHMYKRFQNFTVVYICVDVIFHLWAKIFLRKSPWVEDLVDQLLLMIYLGVVCSIFKMRPFTPGLWRVQVPQPNVEDEDSEFGEFLSSQNRDYSAALQPSGFGYHMLWRPGMPPPESVPNSQVFSSYGNAPLIAVENPPTLDENGNRVENIAIAHLN
jgi:hypothetical protein